MPNQFIEVNTETKPIITELRSTREIDADMPEPADDCLNCGAALSGKFCRECGQERGNRIVSLKESFGELLNEFFKFDAKLFKSFWYLIVKPGFLTVEYAAGRRAVYLQPFKLYLTINFFCFLLAGWLDPVVLSQESLNYWFPNNKISSLEAFNATFSAVLPTLLIIIFPPFAALLKIIYLRSKQFYAFHFIFALHYFTFFLIAVIPTYFYESLDEWVLFPATCLYLLPALKAAYGQSWLKTIVKWLIVYVSIWVLLLIWLFIGIFWSVLVVTLST